MHRNLTRLESRILYLGPSSRGRIGKYLLRMTYGNEYLEYKKNRWKKLFFRNVVSWEAYPGNPPRIVLTSRVRNTTEDREFYISEDFDKWLYIIIRGVMENSKAKVPKKYLLQLSPNRRQKILASRSLRKFDHSHEVFIKVSESLKEALDLQEELGPVPEPVGFHPKLVSGDGAGRTRGGVAYGQTGRSIGSGGSDTVIYKLNRLLQPILKKEDDGSNRPFERPAVPMAVKGPDYNDSGSEQDAYKALVYEARILVEITAMADIFENVFVAWA